MNKELDTAVVAAAGLGTRMWPATKVVSKELFPLGRIPVLLHIVLEMLEAGEQSVYVVVSQRNRREIEALFDESQPGPARMAGDHLVERIRRNLARARISIIEQAGRYGNGSPLLAAAGYLDTSPCLYAFGDDVVIGENAAAGLIDVYRSTASPVMGVQEVPRERVSSFGIVEAAIDGANEYVTRVVEKPSFGQTDSNLASYGRYLITPALIETLQNTEPGRDGELWLTDAFKRYLESGGRAYVSRLRTGTWHTVGDPLSYAEAVLAATQEQQLACPPDRPDVRVVEEGNPT